MRLAFPLLSLAIGSFAHASAFGPDEDYVLDLDRCAGVLDAREQHPPRGTWDFTSADGRRLRITMAGTELYEAQMFERDEALSPNVTVRVQVAVPSDVGSEAVCADLNRDGATDFAVTLWGRGNGLGASFYDRLIALSSGASYRFFVVPTMSPSPADFVTFGKIEPVVMVTQSFVQKTAYDGRLRESRSYFVYNLWAFHGGELVNADSIDERFPKWVRWTFKQPNYSPAKSISDEERRRQPPPKIEEALP
jgi:hypothetical protein